MPMPEVCSPVLMAPRVLGHAGAEVTVSPDEPVFAGHYPGFPILPGACVVEYVRLAALDVLGGRPGRWTMAAIESSRFLEPVLPGDRLVFDLAWSGDDRVRTCASTVTTERGPAVRVRLRFEGDGS
jgi:3-hydroxyacyl-[acyl-carrier-protein] dehydratase